MCRGREASESSKGGKAGREERGCLFNEPGLIIRSTKAECKWTFINYEYHTRQLALGSSQKKKRRVLILMYEKLERLGVKLDEWVQTSQHEPA